MTYCLLALCCLLTPALYAQQRATPFEPEEWVNPLMGTDSEYALSNGNTYPAIALPWGMNFWMPQTGKMGNGWAYTYDAYHIRGFKQTHQPSPWINDYGTFSLMPLTGKLRVSEEDRKSWFSHKAETAKPYYYRVYLADHDVVTEISPTERAAHFRLTYPETDSAFLLIDAFDKGSWVQVLPQEQKIIGYTTRNSGGVPDNFRNYFVVYLDKPFSMASTWLDGEVKEDRLEANGNHAGAVIGFSTKRGERIHARVASSFISLEQAELNLRREIGRDSFEQTRSKAKSVWHKELSRIRVDDPDREKVRTFYSCLYRVLLFPRSFYEIDTAGRIMHYSPYNGEVLPGYMFTDNGFWDTFRAVFPFFNLMYPDLNAKIMEGLVNTYKESGWLPEWASPGHRNCMIGSNSASIIADAYLKGVRGYDIETLYEAILKNTESAGPLTSVGRAGVNYYNEMGYVPYDVGINENAARTLEYAYADFTIWQLAKALKRPQEEIDRFARRCLNYRNLFDPETRLMRGRNKDGSFQAPFNPFKWGDAFTEGNSWHYTWSVFHDPAGLALLMGGREAFVRMLDTIFLLPPVFDESYYGTVIHEIREMQISEMGNYAHGNQPIQHMIYLYNYGGAPWKCQYWIREVLERMYHSGPDGYCGDEDNGQTSAWYVFSSLGFYPVCPGTDQYVFGGPLFEKITLQMPGGRPLQIYGRQNGKGKPYVQDIRWNGKQHNFNWISHDQLMRGGTLEFDMSDRPNLNRGKKTAALPYSFSRH